MSSESAVFIRELTIEHQHPGNVVCVTTPLPRLSWKLGTRSEVRNVEQTGYEIEIAPSLIQHPEDKAESFKIDSADSVLVPWPSEPLSSRKQCVVRVQVHCTVEGKPVTTPWTEWHTLECALFELSEFAGSFITTTVDTEPGRPIRFRKTFVLPGEKGKVKKAALYITSQGVYEAFINGSRVGDHEMAPGWTSYKHRLNYQIFDVTSLIEQKGTNVIGIEVADGWFAGRLGSKKERQFYGKDLAVFAQLEIELEHDAMIYPIISDDTWQCGVSAIIHSGIYEGETYDSQQETEGWNSNNFDASSWAPVRLVDFPGSKLVASYAPPVRLIRGVRPVRLFESKSGKKILDFGQNLVGKLSISVIEKPKGHEISFVHAEVMENGESGTQPLRGARCTDTIICSGETIEDWTPKFTFHRFRYVQINGWDDITEPNVKALVMHTDMRRTGWFNCSERMVKKLHDNTVWSMMGNFLSIPTDCTQRDERLGWTGDIQAFGPSANFLYDTSGMLCHWLDDLAAEQEEDDGVPPFVVPNAVQNSGDNFPQAVWDDVTILLPWALYRAFGDIGVLRKQYSSMQAWIDKGIPRGSDGLWDRDTWQLGDWLDPIAPADRPDSGRTDGIYVADAYLVHITEVMSKISEIISETSDAARYRSEFAKHKALFNQKYITPAGLVAADSQTGLALAVAFGLHEAPAQVQTAADQLSRAVRLAGFKVATGFAGTPIITHALTAVGLSQLAYRMLLERDCPSWLYPVTMGATTIWERWDSMMPDGSVNVGETTSFNHYALGSVVNWLHEVVGGISVLAAGWKEIKVRPVPGGSITWAEVTHESPYGTIKCHWEVNQTEFMLELEVPANSKAVVILPDRQAHTALGEKEEGIVVGSGKHSFSCEYKGKEWPPKGLYPGMEDRL
ncbi:bacterial alpha-L-rhamnosidase-domain-containing protein [Delphinella strobiligena]|nr:bacterial alpha-L-rhamnosidase-domain-containing protein [Delphinella strobiligena]